jgi:hypothetical protein
VTAACDTSSCFGGGFRQPGSHEEEVPRWERKSPFVLLEVEVDGRITFRCNSTSAQQEVLQCFAAANRTGPPLPEPVGVRPPNGV